MVRRLGSALAAVVVLAALGAPAGEARVRRAESILPPGQSGFVSSAGVATGTGSPHLQDQTPLFLRHVFKTEMFNPPAQSTESPRTGVNITRDNFGVPDIHGSTAYNVWWGVGYAVAQDRLFQLELFRRATTGHLAEILGKSYVAMDQQVRRDFYTPGEVDLQLNALPAGLRARFVAVRDGINAWIQATRDDPSKLPGEFAAVGDPHPRDWTIEDSGAIGVYLARTVPSDDGEELNNVRALRAFGPALFDKLVGIRQKGQVASVPRSSGVFPSQPGRTRQMEKAAFQRSIGYTRSLPLPSTAAAGGAAATARSLPLIGALGHHGGSNMWALRGKNHSATFWNGPQLGFQIPELFVEMELHGPGVDIRGSTAPGVPVIGIGHNKHVAWGVTSGLTDDDDLYAERLAAPESYFFKGRQVDMACRTESIDYRSPPSDLIPGLPPSTEPPESGSKQVRLCRTLHGPVQARAGNVAYARRYAIWKREIGTLAGLAGVNSATSVADVNRAAAKMTWNENLMAADDKGHIGYWHPGLLQVKPHGFDERLPYPGTGQAEWRGFLAVGQRPHAIDPKQGFLFNWNNMPSVGWTQGDAPARERLLGPFHRAAVIRDRVILARKAGGGFTRTMNVDAYTGYHAQQRVLMGGRLRAIRKGATGNAATVLATILRWDGNFDRHDSNGNVDPGAAAWEALTAAASKAMFGHYHGVGVDNVLDSRGGSHLFESRLGEVYALRHLSLGALHAAAGRAFAALKARFGTANPAKWREPRRVYHPTSQGAASMPDIPFLDRGTFEQVVELGP